MKILIKNHIFSGGAPRSFLEYAKILLQHGYEVSTVGEVTFDNVVQEYKHNGIKVYELPTFRRKSIFKNFIHFNRFYKIVLKEKPDFILTNDELNATFSTIIGSYMNLRVITVRAGGNDPASSALIPTWNNNQLIVFSQENLEYYIKQKYDPQKIKLVSNRISIEGLSNDEKKSVNLFEEFYKTIQEDHQMINCLVISRLDKEKKTSILTSFEVINKLASKINNVQLIVAGSGNYEEYFKKKAEEINRENNKKLITLVGHVDKPKKLILDSHFIFGKGRSVIEAIMMNRIGIIVNEDGEFSICNLKNLDNLYKYNFSGRGMKEKNTSEDISRIIKAIKTNKYDYTYLTQISERVKFKYDINYLKEKLLPLFEDYEKQDKKIKKVSIIVRLLDYIKIVKIIMYDYLKRKMSSIKNNKGEYT